MREVKKEFKKLAVIFLPFFVFVATFVFLINFLTREKITSPTANNTLSQILETSHSVMWIGPHADDELFVAGTLGYLCKDKGYACTIVAFGKNPKFVKGNEQSAKFLNANYIRLPDRIGNVNPDCGTDEKTKEDINCLVEGWIKNGVKKELTEIIKEKKPNIIFTFEPESLLQVSPSHAASSVVTKQAIEESKLNLHYYYTLQTPHLAKEDFDKDKFGVTDVIDLDEKLWDCKMKVVSFYSPYYPSLEKLVKDRDYQNSRLHKEVFRKAD